jgi:hypothetical protein
MREEKDSLIRQVSPEFISKVYLALSQSTVFVNTALLFIVSEISFSLKGLKMELAGPYRDADTSIARPTSRCILFDGENISFDAI